MPAEIAVSPDSNPASLPETEDRPRVRTLRGMVGKWAVARSAQPESPSRLHKVGLIAGLSVLVLSASVASANADDQPKDTLKQRIKERILRGQPNDLLVERDFFWKLPNSEHQYEFRTSLPIEVDTQHQGERYFRLIQEGRSLRSLRLVELPDAQTKEVSRYASSYHGEAEPTTSGVIELNQQGQPMTEISYDNGAEVVARVGRTVRYRSNIITVPPVQSPKPEKQPTPEGILTAG